MVETDTLALLMLFVLCSCVYGISSEADSNPQALQSQVDKVDNSNVTDMVQASARNHTENISLDKNLIIQGADENRTIPNAVNCRYCCCCDSTGQVHSTECKDDPEEDPIDCTKECEKINTKFKEKKDCYKDPCRPVAHPCKGVSCP